MMGTVINLEDIQSVKEAMEYYGKQNGMDYLKLKYMINDNGEKYIINPNLSNEKLVEIKINKNNVDVHCIMEGSKHYREDLEEEATLERKIYIGFITWAGYYMR